MHTRESSSIGREESRNNPTGDQGTVQASVFQIIFRRGIPIYSTDESKADQVKGGKG